MTKIVCLLFAILLFSACEVQKPLYYWANYERDSYNYLKNSDEASTQQLAETYQKIIENQNGSRGLPPPGIYADYGLLLIQSNRTDEGKAMLLKELELYPESKVFIDRVLKMLGE